MIIRNNFKLLRHLSQIEELMEKLEKEKSVFSVRTVNFMAVRSGTVNFENQKEAV